MIVLQPTSPGWGWDFRTQGGVANAGWGNFSQGGVITLFRTMGVELIPGAMSVQSVCCCGESLVQSSFRGA